MANTIDVLGDNAVTDSIIKRSITEMVDNVVTSIGDYAFRNCLNLTTADFPVATSIGEYAFNRCSNLTTADFPVTTSIGEYAFQNCSKLTTADFPVVTSIRAYAFNRCFNLTTADFPVATSIGSNAFTSCTALTTLILRNTEKVATLGNVNALSGANNCIIYVPDELVDDYKAATNWSAYADRIKGLSELPTE